MGGVFRTRTPRRRRPQAGGTREPVDSGRMSKKKVISQICIWSSCGLSTALPGFLSGCPLFSP